MLSDIKSALRSLGKTPGFTIVVVLTLALAIGANTAIFSVLNAALLRPLPYPEPDRLVEFWSKAPDSALIPYVTGPQLKEWRERTTLCEGIAGMWDRMSTNLLEGRKAEHITGAWVSANYLDVLGVKPMLGRGFQRGEDVKGSNTNITILTYETWQKRFGGDPTVLGRMLNFGGWSCAVIGVLPPHALANEKLEFLQPLVLGGMSWEMVPDNPWLNVIARLKPGVTPAQADAEANAISSELYGRIMPSFQEKLKTHVLPMQAQLVADSRPALFTLLAAVALVLLIACANVANLLLVRTGARQKEMAVRIALGATTGRIIRLALIESVLLSLGGGLLGILWASLGVKALGFLTAQILPHMMRPAVDLPVLVFTLVLAGGIGVIFGLLPARSAYQTDLNRDLKGSNRGSTSSSRARTQSTFMVGEIALTVVLMISGGLLLRSFVRILSADFGFEPRHALICDLSLTMSAFYRDADPAGSERKMAFDRMIRFQREVVRQLEAEPGIESAGTVTTLPLAGEYWAAQVGLAGRPAGEDRRIPLDYVGGNYFRAMGMSLLKGRLWTEADDTSEAAPVVVINDALARTLWPGENPIGRHIRVKQVDSLVVGVVNDVRHARLDAAAEGHVYGPQINNPVTVCLVVRARGEPAALIEDIRRVVSRIDPDESVSNFRSLEQAVDGSLRERRLTLYLFGIFAVAALGLACIGIYGVMAYATAQRERELSIRMALGAEQSAVVGLVVREGLRLGVIGIVLGLGGGFAVARLFASQLYAVSFLDPITFIAVPVFTLLVVIASIYFPARRAARFDAVNALRAE
jgi:putative ABC transport system permease protein